MRQIPAEIRPHLANSPIVDCRELAQAADVLWAARDISEVNAVRRPASRRLASVPKRNDAPMSRSPQADMLCYYHRRFGNAAKQCRPPCNFNQGNEQAGRH